MASYSGRARSQGFDPVKLPDTARRMLEASDRRRYAQRKVYEADIRQRKEYGAAMEAKASREVAQVEANFQLQDEFTRAYTEQLKKNYDQLKKNEETKTAQDLQKMQALGQFAPSIMGMVKDIKEKNEEDQKQFGENLIAKYGISKAEYNELRLNEAELQAEGAANNRIVEQLKAQGASPDEIQAIRDLDGWRLYGAQKQWAMGAKDEWTQFLHNPENRSKKYDTGDGQQLSLEEAKTQNNGMYYNVIRDQLQAEFLKPYSNLNPAFASQYLYKGINEVNSADTSQFLSAQKASFEKKELDGRLSQLTQVTDSDALSTYINSQGLDHAGNRTRVLDDILELVKQSPEDGERLYDLFMSSPSEQNPKKSRGEYWESGSNIAVKAQLNAISKAITANNEEAFNASQNKKSIAYEQKLQEIEQKRVELGGFSREEWIQLDQTLREEQFGRKGLPQEWKGYLDGTDPDTKALVETVRQKVALGIYVDPDELKDAKYRNLNSQDRQALEQLLKPAEAGGSQLSKQDITQIKGDIVSELKSIVGTLGQEETAISTRMMADVAFDKFMKIYQNEMNQGGTSFNALTKARTALSDEFKLARESDSYTGDFALRRRADGTQIIGFGAGFAYLDGQDPDSPNRFRTESIKGALQAEPDYLSRSKAFGDIEDKSSWAAYITSPSFELSQRPTNWMLALGDADPNNNWQDIVNNQRELYGKPRLNFDRGAIPKDVVRPEVQSLLTNKPNAASKARALTITYADTDSAARYKPVLDLIASKESSNDTVHNGYDALNTGGNGTYVIGTNTGTKRLGRPLIDMTVDEVLAAQASGSVHAVGRYQFIYSTLKEQVRKQGIDTSQKFDEAMQDKLAISYFNESVGTFRRSGGDVIEGLGQRWHGLQKVSRAKLQKGY